ncbi:MAG TPA: choice-of-anchor D domain-containing protein [Bryobacteraceae bacterium]|nr:choice-of-anchor D domain-containing protein [Bryobacteraceae bacterium]
MSLKHVYPAGACVLLMIACEPVRTRPVLAQDVISTAIGGGPNNLPATDANINSPNGVAVDFAGNYYISAYSANRVYKVNASGTLALVAGNGIAAESGDGVTGGAASAELNGPVGLAADTSGNIYLSDYSGCVVRKVDATQTITTIAGIPGSCGFSGDNGPATSAKLYNPRAITLDTSGNLYIADYDNCRIRKVALATGTITTVAGSGSCSYSGDGGLATSAGLAYPGAVSVDNAGDIFIGDFNSYRIREVTASNGNISTVAGTGVSGYTGDGGSATAAEIGQTYQGVWVNPAGNTVTITDYTHQVVRQFTVTGIPNTGTINTIAGNGKDGDAGDGGPADATEFNSPKAVVLSSSGMVYVADNGNNRIRGFTVSGIPNTATIDTVAGNGNITYPNLISGVPPSGVVLDNPLDVYQDPAGNTYVSEYTGCVVRELVKSTGLVNIFAGSAAAGATAGTCGFTGVGGPAASAAIGNVAGIARDTSGNIYIADYSNCVVWQVNAATGDISVFAGQGPPRKCGFSGDGGPATSAELNAPAGIYLDRKNNLYIADASNNRIREISGGIITTIAGNGTAGYLGDGDPATDAELHTPNGVAVDSSGNVYIADYNSCVVREVTAATGIISTIAGNGVCGYNGDGLAVEHELNRPDRVALDANGNLFIADDSGQRVRWVNSTGMMTTIAGNGVAGYNGDGEVATAADLYYVGGIGQDSLGDFLICDYDNLRIRQVSAFPALNTSAGSLNLGLATIGTTSTPQVLTLSAMGLITFDNVSITGPFTEADDCGTSLANGATCLIYVFFTPTSPGTATGSITIEDNGFFSNTTTITLSGTASGLSVTGGPLNFGNQAVKTTSAAKTVAVTNKSTASVTMGTITVNETDFAITANTCPASGSALAAGAKCSISVVFKPKTTGAKKGALIINDSDPTSPQIVGMTGTGTSLVVLTPSAVTFPPQAVGTTSGLSKVTLTNNTGASLTLKNPAVTVSAPFASASATTCTKGIVIPAGQTCVIYLTFTPASVGYVNGTLNVSDSDTTSPQAVALSGTGTGIEFSPSTVTLSGNAGQRVSSSVVMTNVGTSTVMFNAAAIVGPNAAAWSVSATDPPCNGSLAAGATCTFTVYFTASIVGSESATYVAYDNSTGSPQLLPLSGTGQ